MIELKSTAAHNNQSPAAICSASTSVTACNVQSANCLLQLMSNTAAPGIFHLALDGRSRPQDALLALFAAGINLMLGLCSPHKVYTERERVHCCPLSAHIIDTDLGVWHTTAVP